MTSQEDLEVLRLQLEELRHKTQQEKQASCPNCGYCPHCGRSASPYPYYPYRDGRPYWYYDPYVVSTDTDISLCGPTTTVTSTNLDG